MPLEPSLIIVSNTQTFKKKNCALRGQNIARNSFYSIYIEKANAYIQYY